MRKTHINMIIMDTR